MRMNTVQSYTNINRSNYLPFKQTYLTTLSFCKIYYKLLTAPNDTKHNSYKLPITIYNQPPHFEILNISM